MKTINHRLISLAQALRRFPSIFLLFQWLKVNTVGRITHSKSFIRFQYYKKLSSLNTFLQENQLRGGQITEAGEYYLRLPNDLFIYYNFSQPGYTLGDGLSLDTSINVDIDLIGDMLSLAMRGKRFYFDVGANNGYFYALRIAKQFPDAQIFAFEPNPNILLHLQKNVKYNQLANVEIIPQALADYTGSNSLANELGANSFINPRQSKTYLTIDIACSTLDFFIETKKPAGMDVIKVDIEGGEMRFLAGAQESIAKFEPVIVMEFKERFLRRAGSSRAEILQTYADMGYSVYAIQGCEDVVCFPKHERGLIANIRASLGEHILTEIESWSWRILKGSSCSPTMRMSRGILRCAQNDKAGQATPK